MGYPDGGVDNRGVDNGEGVGNGWGCHNGGCHFTLVRMRDAIERTKH